MLDKAIKHGKEKRDARSRMKADCDQIDEWFGYWNYPDPLDADQAEAEKIIVAWVLIPTIGILS